MAKNCFHIEIDPILENDLNDILRTIRKKTNIIFGFIPAKMVGDKIVSFTSVLKDPPNWISNKAANAVTDILHDFLPKQGYTIHSLVWYDA